MCLSSVSFEKGHKNSVKVHAVGAQSDFPHFGYSDFCETAELLAFLYR
ncbi:hypothetical protein RV09_GL002178 [Enterococcus moraviensis]|nr:hypothetical protein RV09_GL002178 [Enterococcus moraviensis]